MWGRSHQASRNIKAITSTIGSFRMCRKIRINLCAQIHVFAFAQTVFGKYDASNKSMGGFDGIFLRFLLYGRRFTLLNNTKIILLSY